MTAVFIAGSMKIKHLHPKVKERIDNIVRSGLDVYVGDADGADTSVQEYLRELNHSLVTVFCTGDAPRNNVGCWPVRSITTKHASGTRAFFTAKDLAMAEAAEYGLMIWDSKSTGTLSNVLELLCRHKKSVVFVNKDRAFSTVGTVKQLEELLERMSEDARKKADEKIRLRDRVESLRNVQQALPI